MSPGDDADLRLLLRLERQVTARHDLDDVLQETFRGLRALVHFDGGSIQLLDDEGWIRVVACDPPNALDSGDRVLALAESVAGRVVLTERPVYLPDLAAEPIDLSRSACSPDARSYLAVPLFADGRSIGILQVDDSQPDAFSEHDMLLIVAASAVVAAAIQNARSHARVSAARTRADAVDRRVEHIRRLVELARRRSLSTPAEVDGLLAGFEQALGDPIAVDLRGERPVRS